MRTLRTLAVAAALVGLMGPAGCFKVDVDLNNDQARSAGGSQAGVYSSAPPEAPAGAGEVSSAAVPDNPPAAYEPDATPVPVPPADSQPPAPLPAEGGGSWRDVITNIVGQTFLESEHGAVFYAFDTLAYPKTPVDLAVRLQSAKDLEGVPGVTVAFYRGEWLAGRAATDADGYARVRWTPAGEGNFTFQAKVVAVPDENTRQLLDLTPRPLLVAVHDKNAPLIVIDLDHTVVDSGFFRVLVGAAQPMAASAEVTTRLAKSYGLVYLTHRPDLLTRRSKSWLKDNGYPPAPLLVSEMKDVFDSGKFKTAKLAALRSSFPQTAIGIGDKYSDAQAYVDNGMTAYLIPHVKDKPKDLRKAAEQIRSLNGRGRLQVVSTWRQIEKGIFEGLTYPPEGFARELTQRAAVLEAQKRQEDKDDD